jgi:uncharacterized membrane protein YfcA
MTAESLARTVLLVTLALAGLAFGWVWLRALPPGSLRTGGRESATGFVTIFFDTLGIGCFATTTAIFRALRLVPDELIPGTLNVGHGIAAVLSAFIFIQLIPVDLLTLVLMVGAAGLGSWLGAGVVPRLSRPVLRQAMGSALLVAASIMVLTRLGLLPGGGDALGLAGTSLALAVLGNFLFGGLMTIGIGLYAPCLILISLLGMNPRSGFPIMMGSCAFLMPICGVRFIRSGQYHPRAAIGLTLGGIPALFIAAYLVKSLPLEWLRWGVIVVVVGTGVSLLRAGLRERVQVIAGSA